MLYNKACGEELSRLGFGCGACAAVCPQNIDIPAAMAELAETIAKMPSWAEMCRQREEAARNPEAEEAESVKQLLYDRYRRENTWNSRETNR